jgi:hypothetical protein
MESGRIEMIMNRVAISRIVVIVAILCLACPLSLAKGVKADAGYEIDSIRIEAGETKVYSFVLSEGDGLYGSFRINYGEQIYFFIVDQDGHDEIRSGTSASTGYLEKTYARNDGKWYDWRFIAPHQSTWYVYYSKAYFAPVSGETVSIEGYAKQDTDSPTLWVNIPEGNLTGSVTITVQARDEGFPISGLNLYVDGARVKQFSFQDNKQISTQITWDTSGYEEGEHSVTTQVWDQLGHAASYSEIVTVQHADLPVAGFVIVAVFLVGILCLVSIVKE